MKSILFFQPIKRTTYENPAPSFCKSKRKPNNPGRFQHRLQQIQQLKDLSTSFSKKKAFTSHLEILHSNSSHLLENYILTSRKDAKRPTMCEKNYDFLMYYIG